MSILDKKVNLLLTVSRVEDIGSSYILLSNKSHSADARSLMPVSYTRFVVVHGPTLVKNLTLLLTCLDTGLPCPSLKINALITPMISNYVVTAHIVWCMQYPHLLDDKGNTLISTGDIDCTKRVVEVLTAFYDK